MLVKLEIYHDSEFWCARGVGKDIFTQAETLDELTDNIKEAASLHLEEDLEAGEDLHILSYPGPSSLSENKCAKR